MSMVLRNISDLYILVNEKLSDPRSKDFFLISNPFYTIFILYLYLNFVLKWGPKFMENRKPYNINNFMIVYNVMQIVICFYLACKATYYVYFQDARSLLYCQDMDYSDNMIAVMTLDGSYKYFLLKVFDLLDTIFFVLRKKNSQITFLHIYHHTGMVALTWGATKYAGGGHALLTGYINLIVHVIMYSYYLVSLLRPELKGNIWWKKHLTQLQILQFFIVSIHWTSILFQPECKYPKFTVALMLPQTVFMLTMFTDFYRKTYLKKDVKIN